MNRLSGECNETLTLTYALILVDCIPLERFWFHCKCRIYTNFNIKSYLNTLVAMPHLGVSLQDYKSYNYFNKYFLVFFLLIRIMLQISHGSVVKFYNIKQILHSFGPIFISLISLMDLFKALLHFHSWHK